jgi:hypothetical protein
MTKRAEQRAYSATQLEAIGCGEASGIRKTAKRLQIKSVIGIVAGNETKKYLYNSLPPAWQEKITAKEEADRQASEYAEALKVLEEQQVKAAMLPMTDDDRVFLWEQFEAKKGKAQEKATRKAAAVDAYYKRVYGERMKKGEAFNQTAKEFDEHPNTIRNWVKLVNGVNKSDWVTVLADQHTGRTAFAEITPEAWEVFKADYLRPAQPTFSACYDRLKRTAAKEGWTIPCCKTLENKMRRDVPANVITLLRQGTDALERTYPAQKRDRTVFHALEAVNGDGYQFWPFVDFGDEVIAKPTAWVWQDILSSKILSYRVDVSENTEVIRLATGDMIEKYGIPKHWYLDNTRAAANKTMTGGVKNRYRFTVKPEDPTGIIPMLGGEVHWATPGHGQSKPIERAFGIGGLSEYVDKHPAFHGRGTKAKPVPLAEFEAILAEEVAAFNARTGRRGTVVMGRSFDAVFNESYSRSVITKATPQQRRLWLLACENVTVNRLDASITMQFYNGPQGQNRYWNEALSRYASRKVTVRFDPANLQGDVHCYTLSGDYICAAQCTIAAGFNDADAAREHIRQRNKHKKAVKEQAQALKKMSALEAAQLLPGAPDTETPATTKVVKGMFRQAANANHGQDESTDTTFAKAVGMMAEGWRESMKKRI